MMNASETDVAALDYAEQADPSAAQAAKAAVALMGAALVGFLKGFLLCGLLNLIPILPAYKRSQFSIMSRTLAAFVFGPIVAFVLAAFPLLFVPAYRRAVVSLCERSCAWYAEQDLAI